MSTPSPQLSTRRALLTTLGVLPGAYACVHWGARLGLEARTPPPPLAGATVIALDLSHSMGIDARLESAKALALALVQWLTAAHPRQEVLVVGFKDSAYPIATADLPTVTWGGSSPGTNLQHALLLARALLRPYAQHPRQVLVLTDEEPNAHCTDDGGVYFTYPPIWTTIERTLQAAAACAQEHIRLYPFLFHHPDRLARRFATELAETAQGQMFAVAPRQPVETTLAAYRAAIRAHAHTSFPQPGA
jgi:uncharacterized protein with von Willebrand factor type A (vWA) domain